MKEAVRMVLGMKPSELLNAALDDLLKVEEDPKCQVDMTTWVKGRYHGGFKVDLGGALLVKTLGVKRAMLQTETLGHFIHQSVGTINREDADELERRCEALNYFRLGIVTEGVKAMGFHCGDKQKEDLSREIRDVPWYKKNPSGFKSSMRIMARSLERTGL